MRKALITGITGQDGSFLAELLLSKDYEVHGLVRRSATGNLKNIKHIQDKLVLHSGDITSDLDLTMLIYKGQYNEIYNLAAQSDVRLSFDCPQYTCDDTGVSLIRILEAIRHTSPKSKLYQASSTEMFGNTPPMQNEDSLMIPRSPYGASKLFAYNLCNIYKEAYGLFICNGILGNHESERRGLNFVTRKITHAVAMISKGKQNKLELGNLDAKRDWGYAPDYVQAMWLMLQQEKPDNYAIGTGVARTIREFLFEAFSYAGLEWEKYVVINPAYFRPTEINFLCVDAGKAKNKLGWTPSTSFMSMIHIMMENDLKDG